MTRTERTGAWRPADRPLRLVRSVAAALVCVTAASVGHVAAGGTMPSPAVLAAFAGSAVVAWLLSARRVTASQLLGLLVLCQVVVHPLGATGEGEMSMGAAMIAAHVVATAASVLALARGESFVWQLAERLALRVLPLLLAVPVVPGRPTRAAAVVPRVRHDVRLAHSRWLRGPPVSLV